MEELNFILLKFKCSLLNLVYDTMNLETKKYILIFFMLSKFKKSFFQLRYLFLFVFTAMEIDTIEKLLQSLELESHTNLFKQNELGLELLMSLSESELKEALTELQLPLGNRLLIIKKIQEIKAGGKFTLFRKMHVWDLF